MQLLFFAIKCSVLRHAMSRYESKYNKKVGVLPIRIVKAKVSSIGPLSERNTLDFTVRIGSTPTFLYFYFFTIVKTHLYGPFFLRLLFWRVQLFVRNTIIVMIRG